MYKLEVTLKQHTPLIHFQHDQAGATLRATEVKPKLDKFILTRLGNGNFEDGVKFAKTNEWVISGQEESLNFKTKITPIGNKAKYIIASRLSKNQPTLLKDEGYSVIETSPYFAQEKEYSQLFEKMDRNNKHSDYKFRLDYKEKLNSLSKLGIQYDKIELDLKSFNSLLIDNIMDILPEFFVIENFGTRNGKGFGSFTVVSIKKNGVEVPFKEKIDVWLLRNYAIVYKKSIGNQSPFNSIYKDYKLMKSGYGRFENPEKYQKSLLFLFFAQKNQRWEKRWFKKQINPHTQAGKSFSDFALKQDKHYGSPIDVNLKQNWDDSQCYNNKIDNYLYIRALLGLSEAFDFLTIDTKKKISIKLNFDKNNLERYKSPVIFKIIENNIYLLANDNIPTNFLHDHSPTFSMYKKENDKLIENSKIDFGIETSIKIPPSFSLKDFLSFCMDKNDKINAKINGYSPLKYNLE
jgi:hypothetical protein